MVELWRLWEGRDHGRLSRIQGSGRSGWLVRTHGTKHALVEAKVMAAGAGTPDILHHLEEAQKEHTVVWTERTSAVAFYLQKEVIPHPMELNPPC